MTAARLALAAALAAGLAACKTPMATNHSAPELTLVGEGLSVERTAYPAAYGKNERRSFHSLYAGRNSLFRDLRARNVGDVVTVNIDINDKAQFDNQTGRSREGEAKAKFGGGLALSGFNLGATAGEASGNAELSGATKSKGAGSIDRSERLHLSIAAVVTEVLPDGNLLISGSQEVRVNNEVRVLNVAGIVRPLDIASSNTISYERIAEARISYGGRGKLTAVQ